MLALTKFLGIDKKQSNQITVSQDNKNTSSNTFKGNGLIKRQNNPYRSDVFSGGNITTQTKTISFGKSPVNDSLLDLVKSIEKKVIKIDSVLKESYTLQKNQESKKGREDEKLRYSEKEKRLKKKPSSVTGGFKFIGPKAPQLGVLDFIKRFIFWNFMNWLYKNIIPFLPTIANVIGQVSKAIPVILEVFGGVADILTKFVAGGVRLINGFTKTLAIVSGARSEEDIQKFTQKFNMMMDLALLAAMLAGDAGFNVLDLFKKGKGKDKIKDAAGRAAQKAGGVFRRGTGRAIQRTAIKIAGKRGGNFVKGVTKGVKSLANKATGGVFARGGGRALTRIGIKVAGKSGGKLVSGAGKILGKAAGPIAIIATAATDFMGRKASGQSNLQAGAGTAAGVGGALAGAKGGAAIGAAIGSIFPGPGTVIGGILGGIIGAAGGAWAASKVTDKVTGADKVSEPKSSAIPGNYRGGIVRKYEKGGTIEDEKEVEAPRKGKLQDTVEGKDVGGAAKISILFPSSGKDESGNKKPENQSKSWWASLFGGGNDDSSDNQTKSEDKTSSGLALDSLRETSKTLKKIPFVGELMGISVDIAMGQKPDKPSYNRLAEKIVYIGQSLSTVKNINEISDKTKEVQKFTSGGIPTTQSVIGNISEKSTEELRNVVAISIEKGANDAITDIRKKIMDLEFNLRSIGGDGGAPDGGGGGGDDVRDRDPNARGGYDPRYDSPSGGGAGSPSGAPSGGGGGGGLGGLTPNAKALLNTIRWAEGTSGPKGYNTWFGGRTDMDLSKMTINQVVAEQKKRLKSGAATYGRYTSAAVGAYQMMTPEVFAARAGLDPSKALFTPENQDKMAIAGYMKGQAKLSDAEINGPISRQLIAKISGVWASLPNMNGVSAYGQPVKKYSDLEAKYKGYLGQAQTAQAQESKAKREETYKGQDPRSTSPTDKSKSNDKVSGSGGSIVDIGKNLISQKFAVAEHPDFTKNPTPSGGSYTPGKGYVGNEHRGRGHYEGRAIDVTDWTSGYPGRYGQVASALQKNPAVKMLIHDNWGFYKDGQKSGPGSYSHPTHLHVETKSRFHGGLVNKEGLVKIHKNEFVIDADTVNLLGVDFFTSLNSIENKVTLSKVAPDLISRISESIKGRAFVQPNTDQYSKEEDPKSPTQIRDSSQKTTENLEKFNKQQETKTEESQKNEEEKEDGKKQRVQVTPASHPQTGSGFAIKGVTDGNGRPLILSKGGITAFGEMMQDSKGVVKGSDVASGKRSESHNRKVGGVPNSNHLGGNALDIHGSSQTWMRQKGRKYGWIINDYPGSHGGHFDYKGKDKDSVGSDSSYPGDSSSGGGGGGSGAPSGGGGGGGSGVPISGRDEMLQENIRRSRRVDVEAEPTEPMVPGGKLKPGGGSGGGFTGDELNAMSNEQKWKAVMLMAQKAGAKYPELVAAQFALESGWGKKLAAKNNYFGIKATAGEDATVSNTREEVGGGSVYIDARFKNFNSPQDAINHLVTQWYKDYKNYKGVNNAESAAEAAAMLRAQGYATDSGYSKHLQRLLKEHNNVQISKDDIAAFNKKKDSGDESKNKDGKVVGDPGDVEEGQQIAGHTGGKYGQISSGFGDTDGQDTGADIEIFGTRGKIGKTFGNNATQGPYGNRGVEISFPYELTYHERVPGGRNAGAKAIDTQGSTNRVVKGTGPGGFGHIGSYVFTDENGKRYEIMMGHGNKPFRKFKEGEKIPPGTVVGWQGASGSSDDAAGGLYDHITFHVNAIDPGGDPDKIMRTFANSLVNGEGAKLTAQQRKEKEEAERIAKERPIGTESIMSNKPVVWDGKKWNPKPKDSGLIGSVKDTLGQIGNTVLNVLTGAAPASAATISEKPKEPVAKPGSPSAKPKTSAKPKASAKPNRAWYDPRKWIGMQDGGLVGENVKRQPINNRNVEEFASYENPNETPMILLQEIHIKEVIKKDSRSGGGSVSLSASKKPDNSYMLRRQ